VRKHATPTPPFIGGGLRLRDGCDAEDATTISKGKGESNGSLRKLRRAISGGKSPNGSLRKLRRAINGGKFPNGYLLQL